MAGQWVDPRPEKEDDGSMRLGLDGLGPDVYKRGSGRGGTFQQIKGSQTRSKNRRAQRIKAKLGKTPKPRHAGGFS